MSLFTAGTPESLTSRVDFWSPRNDPRTRGSRLPGTIPARVGVVFLSFLRTCSIQTPTRQRLFLTASPINLDSFRCFIDGGPPRCLRTKQSFFCFRVGFCHEKRGNRTGTTRNEPDYSRRCIYIYIIYIRFPQLRESRTAMVHFSIVYSKMWQLNKIEALFDQLLLQRTTKEP